MTSRTALFVAALGQVSQLRAASPALGVVSAPGEFKLNQASVHGNATLTEGSVVETLTSPSRLHFQGGSVLRLDAGSRVRVHQDHVTVESGSGDWQPSGAMALEALTLRVTPEGTARARFALAAAKTVQLAASQGRFRVMNAQGTMISRLEPGLALAFEPMLQTGAGAPAPSSFIGCVVKKEEKWFLYEPALKLLVELRGQPAAVQREWGNRVQANGTSPAGGQAEGRQVMNVTTVLLVEIGGCQEIAKLTQSEVPTTPQTATPAQPQTAAQTTGRPPAIPSSGGEGMSAGTKYGIIAGVVGGGAVAGIAAATGKRSR